MGIHACKFSGLVVAFSLLAQLPTAFAQQTPSVQINSFSVGPDQTLTYPAASSGTNQLVGLADEHTTFFPPAASGAPYLVFGAAATSATAAGTWGAVVLQTMDLKTFDFATSLGYGFPVLTSALPFSKCNPSDNTGFDENYAAPGSVLQDPTLPAGNLIMLYEAENHCPGGIHQQPFYATVGFARSSDNGKTWPALQDGALGGPSRHPVLQSPEPQPTTPHGYLGDAIPSGFVDKSASGDYYLYIAYAYFSSSGQAVRVARAKLGADPLTFLKWYNGSFSQPGIGGLDSAVTPSTGCASTQQESPEISYNDDLGLYLMIFKCYSGPANARVGGWYYSTATSLDFEDWTVPQLIQNSQYPLTSPCPGQTTGQDFDGFYPSMMSPGAASGQTKLTGYIFFSHVACDLGTRQFLSRTFTIVVQPAAPTITRTLSHAADGNGFKTTVLLTNTATQAASYVLRFDDALGNAPSPPVNLELGSLTGTIPAGESATIRTAGTGSFVGWAELIAPASVGGSVIYSQPHLTTIQEGTATVPSTGTQHFFLPFDNTNGAVTAMALTNSGTSAANLTVTIRYSDGTMETPSFPALASRNHESFTIPGQFLNSSNRSGVAEFVSSSPLYSVAFRFNPTGAFTAFEIVPQ